MNKTSLRLGLIGLTVAGAAASQAYDFVNLKAANTGGQMNILQQGVKSFNLAGSISSTNSNTSSTITGALGYFVTGEIEVFAGANYQSFNSANNYSALFGGRYYIGPSQDKQMVPFVGAMVGFGRTSGGGNNTTTYGAMAGVDWFLAPNVSFTPLISWTQNTGSGQNFSTVAFQFGLTFWMK